MYAAIILIQHDDYDVMKQYYASGPIRYFFFLKTKPKLIYAKALVQSATS